MKKLYEQYRCAWKPESEWVNRTPDRQTRESLCYIEEIGHFYAERDYYTCRENLDSFLVVLTVAGAGQLTMLGRTWRLAPGDLFFIDCSERHDYRTAGESWELEWVHFQGGASRAFYSRVLRDAGQPVLHSPPETRDLLETLLGLARGTGRSTDLMISLTLTQLLTVLALCADTGENDSPARLEYIGGVLRYIGQHLTEKLTLDRLAARFSRNRYVLLRDFSRATGTTPGEYIITQRINMAKDLLRYSDQSVRQISWQVGVENESHFIRLFSARVGCTPGAFRAQWAGTV